MSIAVASPPSTDLTQRTTRIRESIVTMCACPDGGHLGGSMSLVEILATLYLRVMRVDPADPQAPDRDILLLSKGHGGIGLYATLAEAGYFPAERLAEYSVPGGHFMAHPHPGVPGVEAPSGSLGHGLALGIGYALAARLDGSARRCFVVMGDGETQEGSVWEAAGVASHHGLDNLTAIIDRNQLQITGGTEQVSRLGPMAQRWRAFGWTVHEVDGHDVEALTAALEAPAEQGRPTLVIAHTVKGKGLPYLEGDLRSHYVALKERQYHKAMAVLRRSRS
ncbi:transketolase [Micromonospora sp. NPDC048871]|uniref:transketolase n=1 Tax=unclassified Micromonospora TaxID=2617518 RepID=UPI002E150E85|nr:transketolase [Micromonospora sp. NBC_01739]